MPDPKTEPVAPIPVTLVGTGDGTLVPGLVVTPGNQPNLTVNFIAPIMAITVRFAFMFGKSLLGFLTLAMIPPGSNQVMIAIHGMDFYNLVITGVGLSLAPTVYDLLQSLVGVLGRLERKYPLLTGSV